jgi:hypothetical protein
MHDSSLIDTLEKRVNISAVWMDKVMDLMHSHEHKTHMAVVGSSDTTINIANKHCEYIYVDDNLLFRDQFKKIDLDKVKPIVIIDPLITTHPDDEKYVKYDKNAPVRQQHHLIKGKLVDVVAQIRDLSEKFGIYDFMIHTDQEDISKLLDMVKNFNDIVVPEGNVIGYSDLTVQNFNNIGSDPSNIKVLNNYLSKEECDHIIELINSTETSNNRPLQPDSSGDPALSLLYYDSLTYSEKYIPGIQSILEKEFNVKLKPRNSRFAQWVHNNSPTVPIDDLGHKDSNHLAGWVYLNDDYDGGGLSFFNQGLSFKPKAGDLILFPGNPHYWYHVAPANGSRYIMPIWFDFV